MLKNKINVWLSFLSLLLIPFLAIADDVSVQAVSRGMQAFKNVGFGIAWFIVYCIVGAFVFLYFFNLEYKKAFLQMFKMRLWSGLYWALVMMPLVLVILLVTLLAPSWVESFLVLIPLSWADIMDNPVTILVGLCYVLLAYALSFYVYSYAYRHHVNPSVNQSTLKKTILVIITLDMLIALLHYVFLK